jgi:hypothetical protein
VTLDDALAVLGLTHSTNEDEARTRFRELMRQHHPDVSSSLNTPSGARVDPSRITHAYAISAATAERLNHDLGVACTHDGDTLWIEAPPDEAYQLLYEAASHLGGVGHVDRGLGLLEIIVRFEGGPSCSVLFTLQGRAHGTDVFCEMESIEAAPTPAISPVLDSLLEVLGSPQTPSAP